MLDVEERMEISVLSKHGGSIRSIARVTGRSRNTVRRYLRGGNDIAARRKPGPKRIAKLDPWENAPPHGAGNRRMKFARRKLTGSTARAGSFCGASRPMAVAA